MQCPACDAAENGGARVREPHAGVGVASGFTSIYPRPVPVLVPSARPPICCASQSPLAPGCSADRDLVYTTSRARPVVSLRARDAGPVDDAGGGFRGAVQG